MLWKQLQKCVALAAIARYTEA